MIATLLLALAVQSPAVAADTTVTARLVPGTQYDPAIPTLEQTVGHDFGDEITAPDEIARYLQALASAAPERTRLIQYAETWEGRPLHVLVIGAPERIARLEEIKQGLQRLAFPTDLSGAEAERLIAELPVTVALMHSVHGNEISGAGAAIAEAYHLLAAQNDPQVEQILRNALVIIDPSQNPDGRARFVSNYRQNRAFPADPDPAAAEHDEPWPGGRTNHYLFDLNRDWFALTQPESQGKIRLLLDFQPQIVADLHEMGGNSTFYFPPAAVPGNPWTTAEQAQIVELLGRAMAEKFDERGFAYFTREVFDAFYPGYGASWPTTQGALGMTFEQASARGLVVRREDGDLLTYGDGVLHHFTAAMATLAAAAGNRERILRDFLDFRRSATELETEGGQSAYLLHSAHDPALAERLARLLVRNGISVRRAEEPVRADGRTFPAGSTFVVPVGQPGGRLVRNLLDPTTPLGEDFLRRQRERRAQRLPDEIYDVTSWSVPLLWDVEAVPADFPSRLQTSPVQPDVAPPAPAPLPPARVGYLVPWNSAGAAAVADALRQGLSVRALGGSTTLDGRRFPIGTALLRSFENPDDLPARLATIVARHGAEAVPINSAFKEEGVSLGSNRVIALRDPSVLLVWDQPAQSYSAGWARYVLEQRYGQRVTPVRADLLPRTRLADYHVIVLPEGSYSDAFSEEFVERLGGWMRDGGTLITMGESSRWAARAGMLATTTELRGGLPEFGEGARPAPQTPREPPIDLVEAIAPERELPEQTPGAVLTVAVDTTHWLSAGTDGRIGAMVDGSRIFSPVTLDKGTNVAVYGGLDELVAGGIVWEDARPQLASKAFLIHQPEGRGQLIAFAEDPNYRAYAEATQMLFINAVLLGAGR